MKIKLTKNDAEEVLHKMCVLADSPDLLEDYKLTELMAQELRDSIPYGGGEWTVPDWAVEAVKEEMSDHCVILRGIADDARNANERGQALRIDKQAKRLRETFGIES